MTSQSPPETEPDDEILIVAVEDSYYLAMGEEHLEQIMLVDADFPKPIRCLKFRDILHLKTFSNGTATVADLWAINPLIIERLTRDQHLIETDVP